jgi:hypothetical protein
LELAPLIGTEEEGEAGEDISAVAGAVLLVAIA